MITHRTTTLESENLKTKPANGTRKRSTIGDLIYDMMTLGELQGKLLWEDLSGFRKGAKFPVMALLMGFVLSLATVPVFLLAIGWMIADLNGWPVWVGLLATTFILGALPSVSLLLWGCSRLFKRASILKRSGSELSENTRWLKRRIKSLF